ncbi:hypothetical protein K0U27_09115 [archaeon]|nr:hypothetical protein [archaeon]
MSKIIAVPILVGVAIAVSYFFLLSNDVSSDSESQSIYDAGFSYYDIEKIQNSLEDYDIFVSSPTAITDHTINQYCTYFEKGLSKGVEYCTTTAVLDYEGTSLGNINIGGDTQSPVLAIANLETPSLESNQDEVFAVFEVMIEALVCDCWDEEKSEEYPTISSWLEGAQTFYTDSGERNIKSKIDDLAGNEIILEITAKDDSILQTLIILK